VIQTSLRLAFLPLPQNKKYSHIGLTLQYPCKATFLLPSNGLGS